MLAMIAGHMLARVRLHIQNLAQAPINACSYLASRKHLTLTLCMLGNLSSAKMLSAEFLKLAFSSFFFKEYYQNSKQFGS